MTRLSHLIVDVVADILVRLGINHLLSDTEVKLLSKENVTRHTIITNDSFSRCCSLDQLNKRESRYSIEARICRLV